MEISVVLVVLGAAFLHAFWNFLVRGTADKALGMAAVMFGHLPLAFVGLFYAGLPPEGAWPYVMASGFLHLGYQVFLLNAYRFGELTQIYPVARGASPLLITLFTMVTVPGVLKPMEIVGVVMVSGAIMAYGIAQYRNKSVGITGIVLAVITGCFIASYSIVDATGTRLTQSAISYYGASTTANAVLLGIYLARFHLTVLQRMYADAPRTFIIGGAASYFAYVAVLWACLSAPVAVVSSLRETSVLFAVALGVLFLKEKMTLFKMVIILLIFSGVVVLRMA
ncbi:MAG: EamA family transporter [Candidatus Puniceispirillum sp.]|nr:EamA family transporter [Candidatus Puniceispirillum sp.]MBL6774273.1 EamA family transporter [Candidatus Puniceispirillum sp.]